MLRYTPSTFYDTNSILEPFRAYKVLEMASFYLAKSAAPLLFVSPPFGCRLFFLHPFFPPLTHFVQGSFTAEPRPGLLPRIAKSLRYDRVEGAWVNAVGLRNRGIDHCFEKEAKFMGASGSRRVLSLASARGVQGWKDLAERRSSIPWRRRVEFNISCPNVEEGSIQNLLPPIQDILDHLLLDTWKPPSICTAKVSPYTTREEIRALHDAGFRSFHACNTLPCEEGGMSGPPLSPYSLRMVRKIRECLGEEVEVIGGGGIRSMRDARAYRDLGVDHFSISTLCFFPLELVTFLRDFRQEREGLLKGRGFCE